DRLRGRARRDLAAAQEHLARRSPARAEEELRQLRPPRADHAAETEDLARPDLERRLHDPRAGEPLDDEDRLAERDRLLREERARAAADHLLGQPLER